MYDSFARRLQGIGIELAADVAWCSVYGTLCSVARHTSIGQHTMESDTPYRRPPLDPRVTQTQELILSAARQLLLEEGQEAVTPTRLAEVTGISRSTIYRHWSDPLDIIFEATATDTDQVLIASTGNIRTDLTRYLETLRDMLESSNGTLLATQIDRAEHNDAIADTLQSVAALRRELIGELAQHTGGDFSAAHALVVGPLVYQRFMARAEITDELIALVVDAYLKTRE